MHSSRSHYIKTLLLPCLGFSVLSGAFTACLVFAFKMSAEWVISLSAAVYSFVRLRPLLLPMLIIGAAALGLLAALVLHKAPECRGGGIPTVIASLRGLVPVSWIKSAFVLPFSAMLSFLCGAPLGNEGPCVQIGSALGEGAVRIFGEKNRAWRRYIMTGGACAGFAAATGAPIAGILFAVEEAHRRLSPMIFMTASISVVTGQAVMYALCLLTGADYKVFDFAVFETLPVKSLWTVLPIAVICGICAIFFSRIYRACGSFLNSTLKKMPFAAKLAIVFALVAAVGFFSADFVGSGHSLIEFIVEGGRVWYALVIAFLLRALLLMLANNTGVTGGLFIPTLTFGAIIGGLCASALVSLGAVETQDYAVLVVVGMASFLGAASRIPLIACVFALEVLCGANNILPVALAASVSLLIVEVVGEPSFGDVVVQSKVERQNTGRTAQIFDVYLTVRAGAFAVEKEIRDILWPPTCTVLSVQKNTLHSGVGICEGDVLHVHYQTYEPHATFEELEAIVGRQDEDVRMNVHEASSDHTVPEA